MRFSNPLALAFALALAAGPAPAAAQGGSVPDPFAALEAAGRAYRAASALCADFRQTLSVPLLGDDIGGRGRLCTKAPGLFSMRFSDPAGDVYLADGSWFWVYRPSADPKQVLRFQMAQGPRGVDFYSEFLDDPRNKYRAEYAGRETVGGRAVHHVVLTPVQRAPYRSAEVWIDVEGSQLRQVRVREENGSVRTVTLDAIDARSAPPASAFSFTPPAGTQVLTR